MSPLGGRSPCDSARIVFCSACTCANSPPMDAGTQIDQVTRVLHVGSAGGQRAGSLHWTTRTAAASARTLCRHICAGPRRAHRCAREHGCFGRPTHRVLPLFRFHRLLPQLRLEVRLRAACRLRPTERTWAYLPAVGSSARALTCPCVHAWVQSTLLRFACAHSGGRSPPLLGGRLCVGSVM